MSVPRRCRYAMSAMISVLAGAVVVNLKQGSITNAPANTEIIALIAYLQRLGTDIKAVAK